MSPQSRTFSHGERDTVRSPGVAPYGPRGIGTSGEGCRETDYARCLIPRPRQKIYVAVTQLRSVRADHQVGLQVAG